MIKLTSSEVELELNPYGASIYQLKTKNKNGEFKNIELAHEDLKLYETTNPSCFGATCGRFAGRITDAKFTLDGVEYNLSKNYEGDHILHGGFKNFILTKWDYEVLEEDGKSICRFTTKSEHLAEGFPANIEVMSEYVLEKNTLTLNYYATADRKTYLNITNHGYFNLSDDDDNLYNHDLQLDCSKYIVTDEIVIPKEIKSVDNTEYDFRKTKKLDGLSDKKDSVLKSLNGYDSCFLIDKSGMGYDLYLKDEKSGRTLKCISTYPSVVLYTYNRPTETVLKDRKNVEHAGVAIEFQYAPNAMNVDELYIPVIDVDRPYKESIKFIFNE